MLQPTAYPVHLSSRGSGRLSLSHSIESEYVMPKDRDADLPMSLRVSHRVCNGHVAHGKRPKCSSVAEAEQVRPLPTFLFIAVVVVTVREHAGILPP